MHCDLRIALSTIIAAIHLHTHAWALPVQVGRRTGAATVSHGLAHEDMEIVRFEPQRVSRRSSGDAKTAFMIDGDEADDVHGPVPRRLADEVMWGTPFPSDDVETVTSDYTDFEEGSEPFNRRLPHWYDNDGKQKNFRDLGPLDRLGLMQEATSRGASLKKLMDKYVGRRQSRLVETLSLQESNVHQHYEIDASGTNDYENFANVDPKMSEIFSKAGHPEIQVGVGFASVTYNSIPRSASGKPVLSTGINADQGVILSIWSYTEHDSNRGRERAFSSTLTWAAWRRVTGNRSRGLKYQLREEISNQATNNIMSIIHETWDNHDNAIPTPYPTYPDGTSMGPVAGQGRWTPDHPVYPQLLSMPNVATCVQMVADYNTDMDNPYITVIHTFPPVHREYFPGTYEDHERPGYIVIEYGQMPDVKPKDTPQLGLSPLTNYNSTMMSKGGRFGISNPGDVQVA